MRYRIDDLAIVTASNDRAILEACLLRSPDVVAGRLPVTVIEDAPSMPVAYNRGLDATTQSILILVHQDVYLPAGWADRAIAILNDLTEQDPTWEAAGSQGLTTHAGQKPASVMHGRIWDVAFGQEFGLPINAPVRVESLEEVLLILRRRPDYRFDEGLPSFHLYGTDFALTALAAGRGAYAVDLPVIHNARMVDTLRGGYSDAWYYIRRKWWDRLPVQTSCSMVSKLPWHLWKAQRIVDRHPRRTDAPLTDAVAAARAAGYE